MSVLASVVAWLLIAASSTGTLTYADVDRFESQIAMPDGAEPLANYARYYAPPRVYTLDDLPFTTISDAVPGWPEPRESAVVAAVFVKPGVWGEDNPSAHLVGEGELPFAVHGGCMAVNVVIDPGSGRTLASWCNIDDR